MFSKHEKNMLLDALTLKIGSMARMANSRPEFAEVAKKQEAEYTMLRLKIEGISDEAPQTARQK